MTAEIADCLEEALGGPQFKHDVRVVYARTLEERLVEFDAWLSFRPEFAEALTAFRKTFATDTSVSRKPSRDASKPPKGKDEA